jgi:mannose-1-phosphate guanylyltransferase
VVATGETQANQVASHLEDKVDIVIEPMRRDTFPAVVLSCLYLILEKKMNINEPIVVVPVDPYTDNSYFSRLKTMCNAVRKGETDIVLMGIEPICPSSQYGYILPSKYNDELETFCVARFEEKPSKERAESLIKEGGLWNAGVFAFKAEFIKKIADKYIGKYKTYKDVLKKYDTLPKKSFDYEVVEKTQSISMVHYKGRWMDIGTWDTFTQVMKSKMYGLGVMSNDNEGTHVINELDIPLLVNGTKNMIIVASSEGILVSAKEKSGQIKKYVDEVYTLPIYEDKQWGYYRTIDKIKSNGRTNTIIKEMIVTSEGRTSYKSHKKKCVTWTIIEGSGIIILDGIQREVNAGDSIKIKAGVKYAIRAIEKIKLIEVQVGEEVFDSGIEKWNLE